MNIKTVVVGELYENCYIIEKNNSCLIVDPGDEDDKIISEIEYEVKGILVTHSHPDHIGALDKLKSKYNVPIYKYSNLNEENINIDEFNFDIIYTKGHTDDSITFYFKEDKVMFTGDFLFKSTIGRMDLPTGNMLEMKKSINKIINYDDDIKVYPGHGASTTLGLEKKYNDYLNGMFW